jgi:D-sedoheptulose 7-phosphate isomerase
VVEETYFAVLKEHKDLFSCLGEITSEVLIAADLLVQTLRQGNKVLICGNGGSAADSQHFAAEIVGRFQRDRKGLPAIALSTDTSILTAVGNDYGYDTIFARQVEALCAKGDALLGISTSGNSRNVILAIDAAKDVGAKTIGLLGNEGGKLSSRVDAAVVVPHRVTARIQEAHVFIIHFWAACVEEALFK